MTSRIMIGTVEQWAGSDDWRDTVQSYNEDFEAEVRLFWPRCVECHASMHPEATECERCKMLDEEARRIARGYPLAR